MALVFAGSFNLLCNQFLRFSLFLFGNLCSFVVKSKGICFFWAPFSPFPLGYIFSMWGAEKELVFISRWNSSVRSLPVKKSPKSNREIQDCFQREHHTSELSKSFGSWCKLYGSHLTTKMMQGPVPGLWKATGAAAAAGWGPAAWWWWRWRGQEIGTGSALKQHLVCPGPQQEQQGSLAPSPL